jgi:hypothetical protein
MPKGIESRPFSARRSTQERSLVIRRLFPVEMKVSELKAPIGSRVVELTSRMVASVPMQALANKIQGSKTTTTQTVVPNRWQRLPELPGLRQRKSNQLKKCTEEPWHTRLQIRQSIQHIKTSEIRSLCLTSRVKVLLRIKSCRSPRLVFLQLARSLRKRCCLTVRQPSWSHHQKKLDLHI